MSRSQILITGGAGFHRISSIGRTVGARVSGSSSRQSLATGPRSTATRPEYLNSEVELIRGDVRDADAVQRALRGVDAVCHFAACVGVGQSMYDVHRDTEVNTLGTAVLAEALIETPVSRLIVASSMSIYGEGLYQKPDGTCYSSAKRDINLLKARQ